MGCFGVQGVRELRSREDKMYKLVATEIIKDEAKYMAYRQRYDKRTQELGYTPLKIYRVMGRVNRMVFLESQAFADWTELEQLMAKIGMDEEMQRIDRDIAEGDRIIPGSTQIYILTDF
jgi:hypothetical protein